ncbi:MAG: hypothetical protein LBV75_00390 [Paludibacter sp.]|nr:hypothetical protein [Paludibacter sp.]
MNNFEVEEQNATKIAADFEKKWAQSVTSDEFAQKMYQHIDMWEWKK